MDAGGHQEMPIIIRISVEHDDGIRAAKDQQFSRSRSPARPRQRKQPPGGSGEEVASWIYCARQGAQIRLSTIRDPVKPPGQGPDELRLVRDVRLAAGLPATLTADRRVAIDSACVSLWRKAGSPAMPSLAMRGDGIIAGALAEAQLRGSPQGRTSPARPSGATPAEPRGSQQAAIPDGIVLGPGAADDLVLGDQHERTGRRGRTVVFLGFDQDLVGGDLEGTGQGPGRGA